MAQTVTLTELRSRAREAADQENSTFVSDTALDRYINTGLGELYDLLVAAYGAEYYGTTQSLSIVAGTYQYSLHVTFYKWLGLWRLTGSGGREEKELFRLPHEAAAEAVSGGDPAYPRYRLTTATVELYPTPTSTWYASARFIPALTKLTSGSESFDGINGWEEYAVLYAAKCMARKEDEFGKVQQFDRDMAAIKARIADVSLARNLAEPPTVKIVDAGPALLTVRV